MACDSGSADDITECCTAPAKCSTVPALIAAGKFSCPNGQVFNSANSEKLCLASACNSGTSADVAQCCTAPAKCSTIANTKGFCETDGTGKLYDHALSLIHI